MANNTQLDNTDWRNATGPIDYTMTNDVMFRMVLQSNEKVLRGLISSMMHIPKKDIDTVEVLNPIILGASLDDKTHVLDINIKLNDSSLINLEMQVLNEGNWENRSLSYLCRAFDNIQKGMDYNSTSEVTHIGFLDFDLFPDDDEFYSKYMLLNVKTHRIYNDKFRLNVLSLRRVNNATDEDKKWHINEWTKLFKAKTWEDLKMIAKNNEVYSEMADSMYIQNTDARIREICEARREAKVHEEYVKQKFNEQHAMLQEKDGIIQEKDAIIQEKDALIEELQVKLASLEQS